MKIIIKTVMHTIILFSIIYLDHRPVFHICYDCLGSMGSMIKISPDISEHTSLSSYFTLSSLLQRCNFILVIHSKCDIKSVCVCVCVCVVGGVCGRGCVVEG